MCNSDAPFWNYESWKLEVKDEDESKEIRPVAWRRKHWTAYTMSGRQAFNNKSRRSNLAMMKKLPELSASKLVSLISSLDLRLDHSKSAFAVIFWWFRKPWKLTSQKVV